MRRILNALYDAGGWIAAAAVLGIFLVMIGSTALRFFGIATGGTNDIVAWLAATAALLGLAHTFRNGDMVRMTLVLDKLPDVPRRCMEVLALAIGSAAGLYLVFWTVISVHQSWMLEDMANGLIVIPLWIPQLALVFGALLLALALLDELLWVLQGRTPHYVQAVKDRRAAGDFGEGA
jgi:TRAP-type C4-dicarboxylate transport system permease small subunit